MNALRFVIEGEGASTIVDGKDCLMEEGDLVITPGWTWHEHVHRGRVRSSGSTLDAPLPLSRHRPVRPGPARRARIRRGCGFRLPNIVPE
jgi:gentisate 1,2-dioxygenase